MIIDNFKIEIINYQYLFKGMRSRKKANARVIVPTAPNEVKAAMSETGCSRNKFKQHRRTTANGARVEAEKARNETK
jgi:hypothetical protein